MSAQPAAALTKADIGVVPDLAWGISRADMDRTVSAMSAAGVKWARLNIEWSGVEPNGKGAWNTGWLAEIDAAVVKARQAVASSGGWDPSMRFGDDHDFLLSLAIAGARLAYQPGCHSL